MVSHLFTTKVDEVVDVLNNLDGWSFEGISCFIYSSDQTAALQLQIPSSPILVELRRMYNPINDDHLYTTNSTEAEIAQAGGYQDEGVAGWVFPADSSEVHGLQIDGVLNFEMRTVPLYRLRNLETGAHFYTTNEQECLLGTQTGYVNEQVACRVFDVPVSKILPPVSPLFRLCHSFDGEDGSHWYDSFTDEAKSIWDQIKGPLATIAAILILRFVGGSTNTKVTENKDGSLGVNSADPTKTEE